MASMELLDLPSEILHEIASHLEYAPLLAFSLTCQRLYLRLEHRDRIIRRRREAEISAEFEADVFNPKETPAMEPLVGPVYTMADLVEIETWPCYNGAAHAPLTLTQATDQRDFFACRYCLKIRSAAHFSNAMMKGKRGKLGKGTVEERSQRLCLDCGATHGHYDRGKFIKFGGAFLGKDSERSGFVCYGCGKFKAAKYSIVPKSSRCIDCSDYGS